MSIAAYTDLADVTAAVKASNPELNVGDRVFDTPALDRVKVRLFRKKDTDGAIVYKLSVSLTDAGGKAVLKNGVVLIDAEEGIAQGQPASDYYVITPEHVITAYLADNPPADYADSIKTEITNRVNSLLLLVENTGTVETFIDTWNGV